MKLPAGVENAFTRFDRMSFRERALVAVAGLAVLIMGWTVAFYDPITARGSALTGEMQSLQEQMTTGAESLDATTSQDPTVLALKQEETLQKSLADINAQLASTSAGLIPPERMVQVIQDVLSRQRGITLISLHNKPMTTLAPPAKPAEPTAQSGEAAATDTPPAPPPQETGPYMHPVELVIEGQYLDILAYLRALESLEWRFYWKLLELETTRYPTNRVRIELNTLSMDKDWIGV